jgi:DNA-binding MarR family transcriptional regulator
VSSPALHAYRLLIADVYELAGASRASSESLARRHGCTAAQWHVLSVVSEAEMTVSAAAKRLGLSRQAVQRVANDLLRSGHLSARPNPADRRAPLVSLTEAGRTTLRRLFDGSDAARDALLQRSGVGLEDLQQARSTVQHLIAASRRDSRT